jgi:hypothetical protein
MIPGVITTTFDTSGLGSAGSAGTLDSSGNPYTRRFYGKYRGKVFDNIDPLYLGRLMVTVPAVADEPLTWALPCVPYAGEQVGFYAIPPLNANVWVEFEGGDPNLPIWVGCFWEEGQVPVEAREGLPPQTAIFKTASTSVVIRDTPGAGGLSLQIRDPAVETPISINLNSEGIQVLTEAILSLTSQTTNISCDTLTIEGTATSNISGGTLTIETDATNITSDIVGFESDVVTMECEGVTIFSEAVSIASGVTNILSEEAISIESPVTNITSAAVAIEGAVEVTGALLQDTFPVLVVPV